MSLLLSNKRRRKTSSTPPSSDPDFDNVTLLLKGADFSDASNESANNAITNTGVIVSSTESKYGGSSFYFDGSNRRLQIVNSTNSLLNTNDIYTIEGWFFPTRNLTYEMLMALYTNTGTNSSLTLYKYYSGYRQWRGGAVLNTSTALYSLNQWHHFAIVNEGNNIDKLYHNGTFVHQISYSFSVQLYMVSLGMLYALGHDWLYPFLGYIDSFRVTKGIARYTSNFNSEDTSVTYLD
jgi:hypothetical protein